MTSPIHVHGEAEKPQQSHCGSVASSRQPPQNRVHQPIWLCEIVIGGIVGNGGFSEVLQAKSLSSLPVENVCPSTELLFYEPLDKELSIDGPKGAEQSFVIKRLRHETLFNNQMRGVGIADLFEEAKVLASLPRHDNIVTLHGVSPGYWNLQPSMRDNGFLLLEQVDQTLDQCLDTVRSPKSTRSRASIFRPNRRRKAILESQDLRIRDFALGIAKALRFVHKNGYVYRDLKPANVGVTYCDGRPIVKLLDFGLARRCSEWDTGIPGNDSAGTARYMAPEVANEQDHGLACDVHSFAMVMFEILTLQKPYANAVTKKFIYELMVTDKCRPNLHRIQSYVVRDLLSASWHPNPRLRPTFDSILVALEAL